MELVEFDIEFLALKMAENPQSMLFARLADLYLRKGQNDEAMKLAEEGVRTYPDYYAGYLVLGRTHLAFGEFSRAQAAFQKALDLSPFNQVAAKLLLSVPNKPDESSRTTDESYFTPAAPMFESPAEPIADPFAEPEMTLDLTQPILETTLTPDPFPFTAEEEPSVAAPDPFAMPSFAGSSFTAPSSSFPEPEEPAEPFPTFDDYFAQNQFRITTDSPVSLDEFLNSPAAEGTAQPVFSASVSPSYAPSLPLSAGTDASFIDPNDPFAGIPGADELLSGGTADEPEQVFASPEQAQLYAELNALNDEESAPSPFGGTDIDSLAEKLQGAERIVPQKDYQPQTPVPKEPAEDQAYETDAVTPTLAEIYASQGEYRAAIQAYEILMFSQPAKGKEYQARINELQKLQMEKDGLL